MTLSGGAVIDVVPTLVANAAHLAIDDYLQRSRGEWPPQDQLDEIQQLPICLVLVGSKESDHPDQEARASWSPAEMILISKLPNIIKQGFTATKFTFKSAIKIIRDGNVTREGRSHVGSYHLKTTLLHHLEKTPPHKINSPFCLMINLLYDLQGYLMKDTLAHYFLQECNLLTTIGHDERRIALEAIRVVLTDPIKTIIKCPSKPNQIYGAVICPNDLVSAFRYVSADPSCKKGREAFAIILSQLDQWRELRYIKQLEQDENEDPNFVVSSRPDLTGLADMLEKNKIFINTFITSW